MQTFSVQVVQVELWSIAWNQCTVIWNLKQVYFSCCPIFLSLKTIIFFCKVLSVVFKVSEYPLKQNKNVLKNMTVLLYTYFYNISLNVLRPTFFNIYNLPFLHSANIGKIRFKVGPKTNYFFLIYEHQHFSLTCRQPKDKQNRARDFLLFKYFLNNLLLTVFMQNTLSKLLKLLQ